MLHADNTGKLAVPWPEQSTGANVNWILTDYTRDNGCLCVVPGSHTWCRPPDNMSFDSELVMPVEAPAGSAVVWHSNLWHGAFARRAEGQRVMFATLYSRPFMAHEELFSMTTTREMIERNAGRFGVLTGVLSAFPFDQRGPNLEFMVARQHEIGRWT
jgi:ectoine hydroxylase-related dioxygenase (phytanoyl-CoA dioxygenase family)